MPALPNPFDSGALSALLPDEAAALSVPTPPGAAADIQESAPPLSSEPITAAAIDPSPVAAASLDEIDCIGEIFVGARKLNQLPGIFDPAAITSSDELLYVTLKLQDDPHARDLPDVPQGLIDAIEPLPLFLRQAG